MAYIKITNGTQEPYSMAKLRKDNKTFSFPKVVEPETLAAYGVYSVVVATAPSYDEATQIATRNAAATDVGGQWTYEFTVRNKTAEELASAQEVLATKARLVRNNLLLSSDWTQLPDFPGDRAAWGSYRSSLRDVPQQADFPDNVDWPVAPSGV